MRVGRAKVGEAGILAVLFVSATSCAAHRPAPPASTNPDPLAGYALQQIHSHGHDVVQVEGQLTCNQPCDPAAVRVLAQADAEKVGYSETGIVVEANGHFRGELLFAWGGVGNTVSYTPQQLVFTLAGCKDAVVPVRAPWAVRRVELQCN